MKIIIWLGFVALLLLVVGQLYIKDSRSIEKAIIVEGYLKEYCYTNGRYPNVVNLENQFSKLFPNHDWYYWPNETWTKATFQYPMTLPLQSAIGRSKFSEFFPVIYSYAVIHPCKNLISEDKLNE
jgi:hypothetical protein